MHVRVRLFGKPECIVVVESKLTKIEKFRRILEEKFDVKPKLQRLFYGGKLLEDGYTFHDYNIKLNDVIQLMVCMQPQDDDNNKTVNTQTIPTKSELEPQDNIEYKDATSKLYTIGDLVDMRDREQGAWFEGKIVGIVHNPKKHVEEEISLDKDAPSSDSETHNTENDLENKPPSTKTGKGIAKYFDKTPKIRIRGDLNDDSNTDVNLLYKVQLEKEEGDTYMCELNEIRPRARTVIEVKNLKIGMKVMLNYNTEYMHERGYWYDFKITEIKKLRARFELIGTLYLGPEAIPQNDTKVKIRDKIYAIEEVVPLNKRTNEYKKLMATPTEKRSSPLNCLMCRDNERAPCKECGCYLCSGKTSPEKIMLCDECNRGYHLECLDPPLSAVPAGDWYCPACRRDPHAVVAPGARPQPRKQQNTTRDWGRGMACVGKTKTCAMPANHFGPIPGIEVGMCWRFRIQLSESGVHRPPVSGIHGRDVDGAYSIVLSGGYEDDVDHGTEFTYTGSGGRDLSGNKRTAGQSCDQTLTRENKALARNCAVKVISEAGGDAGEDWRSGKPVRVVRSYKMMKHFPKYAPKEGIRYDGIYKVVKYYPERGLSGFLVWKYLLRRDDPTPAPWEPGATQYPIIYPDGYLEAEAEKKALKEKNKSKKNGKGRPKRALRESNHLSEPQDDDASPPSKKHRKNTRGSKRNSNKSPNKSVEETSVVQSGGALSPAERDAVDADTDNTGLWAECLQLLHTQGKKEFIERVTQVFLCIICQEVAVEPVTTPCRHNFCMVCLRQAFKVSESQSCPCCRGSLAEYTPRPNEHLRAALRLLLNGYDARRN